MGSQGEGLWRIPDKEVAVEHLPTIAPSPPTVMEAANLLVRQRQRLRARFVEAPQLPAAHPLGGHCRCRVGLVMSVWVHRPAWSGKAAKGAIRGAR